MKWPGRPHGCPCLLPVLPLTCLLLMWLVLPQSVGAEEEKYTLPEIDPCHATLEAYKQYVTPYIDDYWQVHEYKRYVANMEQWQQCCPGKENSSSEFRPDKTPVVSLDQIRLPSIFSGDTPCRDIFNIKTLYNAIAARWFKNYSSERFSFWYNHYSDINKKLYACCTVRFKSCLEQAPPTSEASASCLEAFSPEHQQQAAAEPDAAPPQQESEAAPDPGSEVLAAEPSGRGSTALVLLGILVLTAGYFLGWPGRSRRARRVAGGVSALIALGVYLLSVALLPDTQFFELLLAVTIAVLVVAARALIRTQIEVRYSGQTPPLP